VNGKEHAKNLGVNERIILEWISEITVAVMNPAVNKGRGILD
jgi:hypothetical protein